MSVPVRPGDPEKALPDSIVKKYDLDAVRIQSARTACWQVRWACAVGEAIPPRFIVVVVCAGRLLRVFVSPWGLGLCASLLPQLLVHSRVHPEVMVATAGKCAQLGPVLVRQGQGLTEDEKNKLRLYPSLTHLIARATTI